MAKDSRTPDDATENREVNQPKDTALPTVSSRGIMAMQGEPELAESAPSAPSDAKPESFEITDWSGYPDGPKPEGPFRILEGEEYENARVLKDQANRALHRSDPDLKGLRYSRSASGQVRRQPHRH